jgi:hypothetical protein
MKGDRFNSAWLRRCRVELGTFLALVSCLASPQLARAADASKPTDATPLFPPPGSRDVLQFLDGATLHGRLRAITTNQGVAWEHPDANSLIQFRPTNVGWIRLEKPKPVPVQSRPTCRLRFHNGDEVFGNLAGMNEQTLELETWFGGALKAPRDALKSITFLSKGFSMLYEGPTGTEGWVHGKTPHTWEYRDGSFVASGAGTLGRDFQMTGSSSFAFDLGWNGHFSLILALYTSVLDRFDYSTSSYMFYLSPGYVTLQRVQGGAGAMNLGQAQIQEMNRKNKLRVEIRASKEESTLSLLIDDRLVQRWKDSSGFVGQGSGAVFFAQLDGPSIRISNLKVAQFEGDSNLESLVNLPSKQDVVYLLNRDRVNGQLQQLQDGKLQVLAGDTPLQIPIYRVSHISLADSANPPSSPSPWELRAYFAGGGTVAFDLGEWQESRISGQSRNFGAVAFEPQYIRQLQFNLPRTGRRAEDVAVQDEEAWDLE